MSTQAEPNRTQEPFGALKHEIAQALQIERYDWRNRRRVERVDLGPGVRIPDRVPTTYRFRKARPKVLPSPPGKVVEVAFHRSPRVSGCIVAQTRSTIDLVIGEHGDRTSHAWIIWDPAWLLTELASTVRSVYPSPISRAVLGLLPGQPCVHRPLLMSHDDLDAEQSAALQAAASEQYSLINGPPGTGKTRVLASLIRELRRRGETVLLAAPSHGAGDVLTERLLDVMERGEGLELGQVVRWGIPQSDRLREVAAKEDPRKSRQGLWIHDGSDPDAARAAMLEADVLITTTARLFITGGLPRPFGTVVVDEGGMCTIPTILAASMHAIRRLVVAGDPHQLGAIVHSQDPLVDRWLRRSVYDIAEEVSSIPLHRLTCQYRMAAPVASLVSDLSYAGRIISAPRPPGDLSILGPLGSHSLVLVDTSGRAGMGTAPLEDSHHAEVIAQVVRVLTAADDHHQERLVLALARYKAQVRRINQALRSASVDPRSAEASTVHSAQGQEAPAVVVDLIPSGLAWLGDYLTDSAARSDGARILTVALSRAIHRLVVVADVQHLMDRMPKDAAARRLLRLLLLRATVVRSSEILEMGLAQAPEGDAYGPGGESGTVIEKAPQRTPKRP